MPISRQRLKRERESGKKRVGEWGEVEAGKRFDTWDMFSSLARNTPLGDNDDDDDDDGDDGDDDQVGSK